MIPFDGYEKHTVEPTIDEQKIKKAIKSFIEHFKERGFNLYDMKNFYHIYTSLCILKHNGYNLTEDEIKNINILHDKKEEDLEKRKQLIDEILEEVDLWL